MKGLTPPYRRRDLVMIRQAINNSWPVDEDLRAENVTELQRTKRAGEGTASYLKSVRTTLIMLSDK